MKSNGSYFGAVISARRKARGLTQDAAGKLLGRSASYVCRLERGQINPSWRAICEIVRELGIETAELYAATELDRMRGD